MPAAWARRNRVMQLIRDLEQGVTKDLEPELPVVIHY